MATRILLTGYPGSGKTTVIERLLKKFEGSAGGFVTREIRETGRRKGFELITLDGRRGTLAHVNLKSVKKVGKYGVDTDTIDSIGVGAIEKSLSIGGLVVIDEIGSMEILSDLFCKTVRKVLASEVDLLGTISRRSHPFLNEVKKFPELVLIQVDHMNRNELPGYIHLKLTGKRVI